MLACPNNAQLLAKKQQISMFIGLTPPGFEPIVSPTGRRGFDPRSSQTKHVHNRYPTWHSSLLEEGKTWLAQFHDNVTECDIGS